MAKPITIQTTANERGERLDCHITAIVSGYTRSFVRTLIERGLVAVDGITANKAGYKLKGNETITVTAPDETPSAIEAEDIPLDVLYEDDSIIVVNKPAGMVVHPGAGVARGTLASALLFRTNKKLSTLSGLDRPGIVHRLDRDTTGVMIAAKNDIAHASLAKQFKAHTTGRRYVALVWGEMKDDEGAVDKAIGRSMSDRKKISTTAARARRAITHYKVLERFGFFTLVELKLETGRTHQVRVHLAAINHPVVGDQVYGKRSIPSNVPKPVIDRLKGIKRQMLHARALTVAHPASGELMEWSAPLPPDMDSLVKELERKCT